MKPIRIEKEAVAGTTESSDIQISLSTSNEGITIDLTSSVEKQYGRQIRSVIETTLKQMGIEQAKVVAVDSGALDCTIQARTMAAVFRSANMSEELNWEEIGKWNV